MKTEITANDDGTINIVANNVSAAELKTLLGFVQEVFA